MDDLEEFEFWCAEYRDNQNMASAETLRLLQYMCDRGNVSALEYMRGLATAEPLHTPSDQTDLTDLLWRDVVVEDLVESDGLDHLDGEQLGVLTGAVELRERAHDHVDLSIPDEIDYPENWLEISGELKKRRGWRCEGCLFQKANSGLLQVHHINKDKGDNCTANLQVLCAVCHGARHRSSPIWPRGISAAEKAELISYHARKRIRR